MRHFATSAFWQAYRELPAEIRQLADKNFELLKANARHPALQFKNVGRFWSARVGRKHRALAVENDGDFIWFWIGSHADYDGIIR